MKGLGTNMHIWVRLNMGYTPNYRLYHRYMYICIGDMRFCIVLWDFVVSQFFFSILFKQPHIILLVLHPMHLHTKIQKTNMCQYNITIIPPHR